MKQSKWPVVQFDDILERVERRIVLDDIETYNCVGVRWYGLGAFIRESKLGVNIRRKKQWIIKDGDVVYNKLFAWKGSFAIADADVDGCIVSDKFPTYKLNEDRVDPRYLRYYFHTEFIAQQAQDLSKGAAAISKLTLNPPDFWKLTIPLPSLDEQRRIVARVEELAVLIEEARGLRVKAREEADALWAAMSSQVFKAVTMSSTILPIGKTFSFRNDLIRPTDGQAGPLRFVGLQHIQSNTGRKIGKERLLAEELEGRKFRFSPGEIVYGYLRPYLNKVWLADCEGVCSVDQYVIQPNREMVDTKYLAHFMRSPIFLSQAIELTHNLLLPRLRKGLLNDIPIPLPLLSKQRRIVAHLDDLQAQVDELTALQDATQAELDALLPSVLDKAFRGEL